MSTRNLYNDEAKNKVRELAEAIDFTMLATQLGQKPFSVVPMSTKKVDDLGNIWFLSGKDSDHNTHIGRDNSVQLIYANPGSMQFLSIYGEAFIVTDKSILEELYVKSDDIWFDGIEDPNLSAIQIKPKEAYYWDTKSNKFVSLFKMGIGAITGKQPDTMNEGKLNIG